MQHYIIERITDRTGRDRTETEYQKRVGREGCLMEAQIGSPMRFAYVEPDTGVLTTSPISHLSRRGRVVSVKTLHSTYYLRALEAEDP